ncbi:cell division protein FtsQ/DivIB [Phycicoccus flavus]|uniref:cell division protein FtsQ/DivIB n=1 Tax=Phycicoccus flavus TaxID=2502783 RepID=UPI000FEBD2FF|nr:FtsQ-type POTRA domain-containing protein [Phycicoccus flavus]NHA66788.1 FtsQ-type POTRA domain-containing protein [Phycicoccus flavus]
MTATRTDPAVGLASSATRFRDRAIDRRRRPWRRVLGGLLAAAVVAGGGYVAGWTDLLGVHDVQVVGVSGAEERAVRRLVGVPEGTPLARVDTGAVEAAVRRRVTVAEVSVHRAWPRTLEVDVVPRTASIVVRTPDDRLEVVDATGVAFGTVRKAPRGVPLVTARGEEAMTPEALHAALAFLEALPEDLERQVTAVGVSSANLVTFRMPGRTVVWGGESQGELKVRVLRTLLTTRARTIDVSAPETPVTR